MREDGGVKTERESEHRVIRKMLDRVRMGALTHWSQHSTTASNESAVMSTSLPA